MHASFEKRDSILAELVKRIMNNTEQECLYVCGKEISELTGLYKKIRLLFIEDVSQCEDNGLYFIEINSEGKRDKFKEWIQKKQNDADMIVYFEEDILIDNELIMLLGMPFKLVEYSQNRGSIYLLGKTFRPVKPLKVPDNFRVLAIIHCFNEADVIEQTVEYLLGQGIDVSVVDNWSDDGTFEIVQQIRKNNSDRVYLERFPETGRTEYYEWYHQLERTEEISKSMDYDWFIHYDADEMRISPWKGFSLRETIYQVEKLGYNLIENTVIDFKLTQADCTNIFMQDTYFDFGHRPAHFEQIKTWKKTKDIDLKKSGGHIAVIREPKIFPLKILNRHYPLRSIEQGERKIFAERLPRFIKEQKLRGWHGHYSTLTKQNSLLSDAAELLCWDEESFEKYYIPLFTGCGVRVDSNFTTVDFDELDFMEGKKVVIYGAGNYGKDFYKTYSHKCNIVAWVDSKYSYMAQIYCEEILSPKIISDVEFDYVVIAVKNKKNYQEIFSELSHYGVQQEKIIGLNSEV